MGPSGRLVIVQAVPETRWTSRSTGAASGATRRSARSWGRSPWPPVGTGSASPTRRSRAAHVDGHGGPGSGSDIVVHLPAAVGGAPVVNAYRTPRSPIAPGKARVLIAHTATVAPADVRVDGKVVFHDIANGEYATADVAAGEHTGGSAACGADHHPILGPLHVDLKAGTVTMVYAVGNPKQRVHERDQPYRGPQLERRGRARDHRHRDAGLAARHTVHPFLGRRTTGGRHASGGGPRRRSDSSGRIRGGPRGAGAGSAVVPGVRSRRRGQSGPGEWRCRGLGRGIDRGLPGERAAAVAVAALGRRGGGRHLGAGQLRRRIRAAGAPRPRPGGAGKRRRRSSRSCPHDGWAPYVPRCRLGVSSRRSDRPDRPVGTARTAAWQSLRTSGSPAGGAGARGRRPLRLHLVRSPRRLLHPGPRPLRRTALGHLGAADRGLVAPPAPDLLRGVAGPGAPGHPRRTTRGSSPRADRGGSRW